MSGREVNLDMAYIILGLHGEIEMISVSTRPITSETLVRSVFVAVAVIANTVTDFGRRLLISPTRSRILRNVSPLIITMYYK